MGKEGQQVPAMSDEWVDTISKRYIELFEKVTGRTFIPESLPEQETKQRIIDSLGKLETPVSP
jgi:phosphoribosylaminoimidazole-succinocarboxamide synthase